MSTLIDWLQAVHATLERLVQLLNGGVLLRADWRARRRASRGRALPTWLTTCSRTASSNACWGRMRCRPPSATRSRRSTRRSFGRAASCCRIWSRQSGRKTCRRNLSKLIFRHYAARLQHNMTVEESTLFPAAVCHLAEDEFRAPGFLDVLDVLDQPKPVFQTPVDVRFAQLHRVIANEATCGCRDASLCGSPACRPCVAPSA